MVDYHQQAPPQNIEAEAGVLGALLIDNGIIGDVINKVEGELFYSKPHKIIYKAISEMYNDNLVSNNGDNRIDIVTLSNKLRAEKLFEKAGGAGYIVGLMEVVSTSANVQTHIDILKDKHMRRVAIQSAERVISASYNQRDVDTSVDELNASMDVLGGLNVTLRHDLESIAKSTLNLIDKDLDCNDSESSIIKTGYSNIDNCLLIKNTKYILVAARTSIGKTAFGLNLAKGISKTCKVGYLSLEMKEEAIVERLIADEASVGNFDIARRKFKEGEYERVVNATEKVAMNKNLILDCDYNSLDVNIYNRIKMLKRKFGVKCVFVDYIQLIMGKGNDEAKRLADISRNLFNLAHQLDIAIIGLVQLNRGAVEDSKPKMSSIKGSGAFEQDADAVVILSSASKECLGEPIEIVNVEIAKQRGGWTGTARLKFDKPFQRFSELPTG